MKSAPRLRLAGALEFDPGLPPMMVIEEDPEFIWDVWWQQVAFFLTVSLIYWIVYVRPTAHNFLRRDSVIAPQVKGRWTIGMFDCFGNCGLFMCSACCFLPNVVDMWYRAGWLHELCGGPDRHGSFTVYMGGVLGLLGCSSICPCCIPCCLASLRGGTPNAAAPLWDGAIPHETRFEIPRSDFIMNCLMWCCCSPCMLMQERK